MADKYKDIRDDEFRIIGQSFYAPSDEPEASMDSDAGRRKGVSIIPALIVIIIGILAIIFWPKKAPETTEEGLFEEIPASVIPEVKSPLGAETDASFTQKIDTVINDIPLTILIPHNAIPELCLQSPSINDKNIILAAQAADIRKDNKKIVGAFVLNGSPLAWGLSKKGYCGIIDGEVTIGVADNSPLFEKATETNGYFFRQYPLVDNGTLVENEPKNKALRKALCDRDGEIFIVKSETTESFHDFAQALVDLGVNNAIYLVGSTSYGFSRGEDGSVEEFSDLRISRYKYESYILWKKNN